MQRSGSCVLLRDRGFSRSSHFRLECLPHTWFLPTIANLLQSRKEELNHPRLSSPSSNFLCTSSFILLRLQTESSRKGWVGDADRGGVASGKEEQARGQKKLMRRFLFSCSRHLAQFCPSWSRTAHREIVCEPLLIWTCSDKE